jgi:hypothetical protein
MFSKGTLCISGFGHFAERATDGGVAYYDTLLTGTGDKYPDPKSVFLASADNYILMTFVKKARELIVDIKGLDGSVLDTVRYAKRTSRRNSPQSSKFESN